MSRFYGIPVLEPDLHRALRHVDLLGYSFPSCSSGGGVLVEFDLECLELVLGRPLALLILLLLREGALSRGSARCRAVCWC